MLPASPSERAEEEQSTEEDVFLDAGDDVAVSKPSRLREDVQARLSTSCGECIAPGVHRLRVSSSLSLLLLVALVLMFGWPRQSASVLDITAPHFATSAALPTGFAGFRISVVYMVFIHPARDWRNLVLMQLQDLIDCGLASHATVHVVMSMATTGTMDNDAEMLGNECEELIRSVLPTARLLRSPGNRFEYPGIRLLWDVAQEWWTPVYEPQWAEQDAATHGRRHVLFYHHSKHMVNGPVGVTRSQENLDLTRLLIKDWRAILQRLAVDEEANKVGFGSTQGFMWVNFYWVRASHLRDVVRPIVTDYRYYYELWLARVTKLPNGTLPSNSDGSYWSGNADGLTWCRSLNPQLKLGFTMEPEQLHSHCYKEGREVGS